MYKIIVYKLYIESRSNCKNMYVFHFSYIIYKCAKYVHVNLEFECQYRIKGMGNNKYCI